MCDGRWSSLFSPDNLPQQHFQHSFISDFAPSTLQAPDDCAPAELINFNFSLITWQFSLFALNRVVEAVQLDSFEFHAIQQCFSTFQWRRKMRVRERKLIVMSSPGDYEPHNSMLQCRGSVDRGYVLLKKIIFILFHAVYMLFDMLLCTFLECFPNSHALYTIWRHGLHTFAPVSPIWFAVQPAERWCCVYALKFWNARHTLQSVFSVLAMAKQRQNNMSRWNIRAMNFRRHTKQKQAYVILGMRNCSSVENWSSH